MGARRDVARAVLLHVNLMLATYGGAALVTGSLIYWYGVLSERTSVGRPTALALGASGVALLLLAHAGVVAVRRKPLLLFALGSWATALGTLGAAGWLAWRSTRLDVCDHSTVKPHLCALLFMLIVDKKNQLLLNAKKMDDAKLEILACVSAALLVLLVLLLLLAGVMALCARPALRLASDPTHSMFRRSSSVCYEGREPLPLPFRRPSPASPPLFMNHASMSAPPPVCFEYPYMQ
ncbi:uncharacterized protein LOC113229465 isoform X2 [Hyposmocoma kahamanoa]|uniref:uncharacterized protein LOC113229465 isoform X2 n=1 Tax=Hyposmocoma kahamanoa TaxID=1477025 RepID=UPI000E6D8758|nr:uncharacterized protein LOC113229465 isoform X2 [Hyposmocoma kahamanoa]